MRYKLKNGYMPTNDDVASDPDLIPSRIKYDDAIDYDVLRSEILKYGPLQRVYPDLNVKWLLHIELCQCTTEICKNDIIRVTQISGFTSLTSSIDKELLLKSKSLNDFFDSFFHKPLKYYSCSGEQQYIEMEIEEHLGVAPLDLYSGVIKPEDFAKAANPSSRVLSDFWFGHNIQVLLDLLRRYRAEIGFARKIDLDVPLADQVDELEDFGEYLDDLYNLGFLTGRVVSEHFIHKEIEPFAEKGVAAAAAQKKRSEASGAKSHKKRHQRIKAMLVAMENLVRDNPVSARMNLEQIAELAIDDSSKNDPELWSQGKGQKTLYLDEMASDLRYQKRYNALKSKTA